MNHMDERQAPHVEPGHIHGGRRTTLAGALALALVIPGLPAVAADAELFDLRR